MTTRTTLAMILGGLTLAGAIASSEAYAQRGGGGRSAGHRSAGAGGGGMQRGGSMQRPGGAGGGFGGGMQRPGGAGGGGMQRPGGAGGAGGGGMQRPGGASGGGMQRPGGAQGGGLQRPGGGQGGGFERPSTFPGGAQGGGLQRPGGAAGTGAGGSFAGRQGASSSQLSDFLGMPAQGAARPGATNAAGVANQPVATNRANLGTRENVGARAGTVNNLNIGEVNAGNRVNYADNRQAWEAQRNNWGNEVRGGVGDRYNNAFGAAWYSRPYTGGGYHYWSGWAAQGPNYAWTPAAWAGVGAFLGGSLANAEPMYYGYGTGGNVYYEDNSVYVNGQPAGTPEQYYQQTAAIAQSAPAAPPPDQANANAQEEWLPLGVFALTAEDAPDASAAVQLAVNKQGVIAGTFYNDQTQASRPVQGKVDTQSQRAVLTFADGQNTDTVLETGVYNLTQDQAPGLLHLGADHSQPVLLVRLKPPSQ